MQHKLLWIKKTAKFINQSVQEIKGTKRKENIVEKVRKGCFPAYRTAGWCLAPVQAHYWSPLNPLKLYGLMGMHRILKLYYPQQIHNNFCSNSQWLKVPQTTVFTHFGDVSSHEPRIGERMSWTPNASRTSLKKRRWRMMSTQADTNHRDYSSDHCYTHCYKRSPLFFPSTLRDQCCDDLYRWCRKQKFVLSFRSRPLQIMQFILAFQPELFRVSVSIWGHFAQCKCGYCQF